MTWSDKKKWQMDLVTKIMMALVIAIAGAGSAYLIDQRFQSKLSQQNALLQKQLAHERFIANRIEVQAQALEHIGNRFMETSYQYSDALVSAFNDTYYRHSKFHGDSKGENQLRYENEINPKLNAILSQLIVLCPSSAQAISTFKGTREQAFNIYNKIENMPEGATPTQECRKAKGDIANESAALQKQATDIYKEVLSCVNDLTYNNANTADTKSRAAD